MENNKRRSNVFINAIAIGAFIIAVFLLIRNLQQSTNHRIAYVDNNKLMTEYKEMIKLKQRLEVNSKKMHDNVDTLALELENSIKSYEKHRSSMNEREKKTNEELLIHKKNQYDQYREAVEKKINEENGKEYSVLLKKINVFIKNYGEKNKYKMIIGANESGNLVYADTTMDLTEKILDGLNAGN